MFVAVNDPKKFLLFMRRASSDSKEVWSFSGQSDAINRQSRVLSKFYGIYHLKRTGPDMYAQVRYQAVHLVTFSSVVETTFYAEKWKYPMHLINLEVAE